MVSDLFGSLGVFVERAVGEEALEDPEQAPDVDLDADLLAHLPFEPFDRRFSDVEPPTGKGPEVVGLGAVEEDSIGLDGDAGDPAGEQRFSITELRSTHVDPERIVSPYRLVVPRYVAFLRAVNTPGRNVKMERIRLGFESAGYDNVHTFIASGNVIFDAAARVAIDSIESALEAEAGFRIPVFLRTADEVIDVADLAPFGDGVDGFEVSFLPAEPDQAAAAALVDTITGPDQLAVIGREVYWLLGGPRAESDHREPTVVKVLGMPTTRRAIRTVRRIADQYLR